MADIKFHCPECQQKIAVDESAAGLKVDCPKCRSALVIPAAATAPVQVVTRRKQNISWLTVVKREHYQHGFIASAEYDSNGDGTLDVSRRYDRYGEIIESVRQGHAP